MNINYYYSNYVDKFDQEQAYRDWLSNYFGKHYIDITEDEEDLVFEDEVMFDLNKQFDEHPLSDTVSVESTDKNGKAFTIGLNVYEEYLEWTRLQKEYNYKLDKEFAEIYFNKNNFDREKHIKLVNEYLDEFEK